MHCTAPRLSVVLSEGEKQDLSVAAALGYFNWKAAVHHIMKRVLDDSEIPAVMCEIWDNRIPFTEKREAE